jgi:hypothetical protein
MESLRVSAVVVALLATCLCNACGAGYPPPEGYVEACYGGDFRANLMNGEPRKFEMRVAAEESTWPELRSRLVAVAVAHELEVFDTSMAPQGLRMFEVSLCSSKGLWVYADRRIWERGPPEHEPGMVVIVLRQYKTTYDWRPVAAALEASLGDWPGKPVGTYLAPLATAPNKSLERTRGG